LWEEEVITIYFGSYVWVGKVFVELDGVKGLFLEGQHWGELDLRKGYVSQSSAIVLSGRGCVMLICGGFRVVAILDLAGDCFGCSQLVLHLRNSLGETCILCL